MILLTIAAVRDFEKKLLMKMQYDVDAKKNAKKYTKMNPRSENSKSSEDAIVRMAESGSSNRRKCRYQDNHRASLLSAIMSIPSRVLLSFSLTSSLMIFARGYNKPARKKTDEHTMTGQQLKSIG